MTTGIDTSVAIPLLVEQHEHHERALQWAAGRRIALTGHAQVETYSALTRLPEGLRVDGDAAARLLVSRFDEPLCLREGDRAALPFVWAEADIIGGAVYDALIAYEARVNDVPLASRDGRAARTYAAVGAAVEFFS